MMMMVYNSVYVYNKYAYTVSSISLFFFFSDFFDDVQRRRETKYRGGGRVVVFNIYRVRYEEVSYYDIQTYKHRDTEKDNERSELG